MSEEKTEWTDRIKKVGDTMFELGGRNFHANNPMVDRMGNACDDVLKAAREMDAEIIRLNNILGTKASMEAIDDHVIAYGVAYVYDGRLLDPSKLAIRYGDIFPTNMAKILSVDRIEVTSVGYYFKIRIEADSEDIDFVTPFSRKELREVDNPYRLVLDRIRTELKRRRDERRSPCASDSVINSTGDSPSTNAKAPTTTATKADPAESASSPSADNTSEEGQKDKPADDHPST
jgi:hypothetical protein